MTPEPTYPVPPAARGPRVLLQRLGLLSRLEFAAGVGVRGIEAVAKFALYALAAHRLGPREAGIFFLALSLTHLLATASRLGVERAIARHVAAEHAVGAGRHASTAGVAGAAAILAASAAVGLVVVVGASTMATTLFRQPDLAPALATVGWSIPIVNAAFAAGAVLMGIDRGVAAQVVMNAGVPVLTVSALLVATLSVNELLIAYAGSFGVCALAGTARIVAKWPASDEPSAARRVDPLPSLWKTARPLYVVELGQAFLLSLPVLALGRFATPEAVATFSIASRLSMLSATMVLSIAQVASSRFARHHRRGEWTELRQAFRQSWRSTVALCLPILSVMVLAATPLLHLLGTDRGEARGVLWVLAVGQVAYCLAAGKDMLLTMAGLGWMMRRIMLVQLAVCILLAAILVPTFGVMGAAATCLAQWLIYSIGSTIAVRRLVPQMKDASWR